MKKALVLGGGMVGSVMAVDLARSGLHVTVADARAEALSGVVARDGRIATVQGDLTDAARVQSLARQHDVVVGALSSVLGYSTLRTLIEAGRPIVDISFMEQDALALDALARERGVVAVVDCGVTPGISNVLCGHAVAHLLDRCDSLDLLVGGLPAVRRWPWDYKAPFAPYDVIEEYTRPARLVEHGVVVVREALSEAELMDLPGVGTVEAFNTDGLRTLLSTMADVPFMKEKTLRWPGHIALMRAMREAGLFSTEPVVVNSSGQRVVPRELTSALLFPQWRYQPGEADLTVMRVRAVGTARGSAAAPRRVELTWDLLDHYDAADDVRSMSRTTGFPATCVARILADGAYAEPGVHPPEHLGRHAHLVERLLRELGERGVHVKHRARDLDSPTPPGPVLA